MNINNFEAKKELLNSLEGHQPLSTLVKGGSITYMLPTRLFIPE